MPGTASGGDGYFIDDLHLAAHYANMTIEEALDLPVDMFRLCLRQAVIAELRKTPEGQEYLETCERLQRTDCDIDKLREVFGNE